MKKLSFVFILTVIFSFTFSACNEDLPSSEMVLGDIALYLIDSYETVENSTQIIESSVVTKKIPLISYNDFISYDLNEYTFEISDGAENAVKDLNLPTDGTAFAMKSDDEIVYTGYFWPSYSSGICNWIIIDPYISASNKLKVHLGYPWEMDEFDIPDKRNDSRIIQTFRRDNKLIE